MDYTFINQTIPMSMTTSITEIVPNNEWVNNIDRGYFFQSSVDKLKDLIDKYGPPNYLDTRTGGSAVWLKRDFYESIILYDRVLINKWPKNHNSIIDLHYHIHIDRDKWKKIEDISSDILYDFIKENLIIRCPNISYGNSLLAIIKDYLNDTYSWSDLNGSPLIINKLKRSRLTNKYYQNKDIKKLT